MTLSEGKEKFIGEWGSLCMNWGVNKTMGKIHALMLIFPDPLSCEQIMEHLEISRGNVNMNVRSLIDWGLVKKVIRRGERKEYFEAEKDFWKVFRCITERRKKKELDPLKEVLSKISCIEPSCPQSDEFCKVIRELNVYTNKVDSILETIIKSDQNWVTKKIIKML